MCSDFQLGLARILPFVEICKAQGAKNFLAADQI